MGLQPPFLFDSKTSPAPAPQAPAPAVTAPVANPFTVATTVPHMSPFELPADAAPATLREPPQGEISIDIAVDVVDVEAFPARAPYASAPSAKDLLRRAAELGPPRMTWASIVVTSDPVLDEKRQPHVAERRARFTRVVKGALGACVALCVLAVGVNAISGGSDAHAATSSSPAVARTVPAKAVVSVEQLEGARHAKAARRAAPPPTAIATVRPKRR